MSDPRFPPVVPLSNLDPWGSSGGIPIRPGGPDNSALVRAYQAVPVPPGGLAHIANAQQFSNLGGELYLAVPQVNSPIVLARSDTLRNMLILRNPSATANIYVTFGNFASLNSALRLTPNMMIMFDSNVPQDDVYALADAAAGFITIAASNVVLS